MSCENDLARVEWEIGFLNRTIPSVSRFINANYVSLATLQGMIDALRGQMPAESATRIMPMEKAVSAQKEEEKRGGTGGGDIVALLRDIEDMEARLARLEAR